MKIKIFHLLVEKLCTIFSVTFYLRCNERKGFPKRKTIQRIDFKPTLGWTNTVVPSF